jgi:hypothetical protein
LRGIIFFIDADEKAHLDAGHSRIRYYASIVLRNGKLKRSGYFQQ